MEAIVVKVLKKQLKTFIKNFNADQLSISAMKGEGQMTDLELSEPVIQELLYIPMNLEVTKASCDLLNLKVPWTSLNSKPVVLTLNKVDIDLREPMEIKPMTSSLKRRKPKTKGDVTDHMQVVINNVHMTVQTLGGTLVMIDLDDILIQSTNSKWEVVDLVQSKGVDKDLGVESLHKKLTIRAINLALITDKSAHMVLQQIPFKILFTSKRRTKDWVLINAELEFILEKLNFRWTQEELLLMVNLIKGFKVCLSRPVPNNPVIPKVAPSDDLVPASSKPNVSYKMAIQNWSVDFIEELTPVEDGYSFFGEGLDIIFHSAKTSTIQKPVETTANASASTSTVEVEEMLIRALISTIKFRELIPREHTSPFFVTQQEISPSTENSGPKRLLEASLLLRRPISADTVDSSDPLIGVELSVALSNLLLVADRAVWKNLIHFFASVNIELPKAPTSPTAEKLEDAKLKLNQLKDTLKLTDEWQNQIKIAVKASDLRVIIPGESSGEYKGLSLQLDLGEFGVSNLSDWKFTPNLQKGLAILAAPSPPPPVTTPRTVGPPHKLSFHLEGVGMAVHWEDKTTNILEPAGVRLFVHYFEREGRNKAEKGKPQLEVVFYSGEFNLHANQKQVSYLKWIGRKYLDPRKVSDAMNARVKKARAIAAEKIKDFKASVPKTEMVKPIKAKVSSALEAYKWVVYVHIDKGIFKVPLQYFIAPNPTEITPEMMWDPLSLNPNTSVKDVVEGDIDNPCLLRFEHLDLALENNMNGQGVVAQLGNFQASGLDHPKLPSSITLEPLQSEEEEKLPEGVGNAESLLFRYKRKRKPSSSGQAPEDDAFLTEVLGRLQRMHVKVARKPNHPGLTTGIGLPDVQGMINRVVSVIQERKGDINAIKQNVKQLNFDLKWSVELGNCEVSLQKVDNTEAVNLVYKPYGTLRLVDMARPNLIKTCKDFETRLVTAKISLAQNEVEKEEQNTVIQELKIELSKVEAEKQATIAKMKEDYENLEKKLVQAKVAMAQMQEDFDNINTVKSNNKKK